MSGVGQEPRPSMMMPQLKPGTGRKLESLREREVWEGELTLGSCEE